ncbi:hypothetical protein GW17_00009381 [Ensete ventricosum]|nr:hypothetical protein GW17_00009381 [Ensete ventricosum]
MAIFEEPLKSPFPSIVSSSPSPVGSVEPASGMEALPRGSDSVEATREIGKIETYSPLYYAACTFGGLASCGLTHMAITPLDVVKCNMQVSFYNVSRAGFSLGLGGFFKGWVPTLLGYSAQGACKFGFYEFFKKFYADVTGPKHASKYKTLIYLAGAASAEVIADIALCPMEAVKVRVQTQPLFARGLRDGLPKFLKSEGVRGYEYTMMKFASFETIVEMIYKHVIPKPKEQCSKPLQLAVSFAGGYAAGVLCAVISHPADNLVSFLNNAAGATVTDVSLIHHLPCFSPLLNNFFVKGVRTTL